MRNPIYCVAIICASGVAMTDPDVVLSPRLSAWRLGDPTTGPSHGDVRLGKDYQVTHIPVKEDYASMREAGSMPEPSLRSVPPGETLDSRVEFDAKEAAAFNLGMRLFDRDFRAVAGLVQRQVGGDLGILAPWSSGRQEGSGQRGVAMSGRCDCAMYCAYDYTHAGMRGCPMAGDVAVRAGYC